MQSFKELLAGDELIRIFAVGRILDPVVIDLVSLAGGFHGLWIDDEHCGLTVAQIQLAALAARANGIDTFVRMAPTDYSAVTQYLEAGAGGVMAARIESAAHAEEFVQWAKFAPRGSRGLNTGGRDADYTYKPAAQFCADANREQLVAIQIETAGALAEVDAIAAIDGVDLLFVGPSDLSQALGIVGQFDHDDLWAAYAKVDAACRQHGKHWATVCVKPEFSTRAVDLGARMISFGADVLAMKVGIETLKSTYQKFF